MKIEQIQIELILGIHYSIINKENETAYVPFIQLFNTLENMEKEIHEAFIEIHDFYPEYRYDVQHLEHKIVVLIQKNQEP